ncbi:MAG: gamma-glutamylcyclotransferase [Fuerstiella sp.]|nr:gamma-glutamylcyclotransferase [Fuerstiella sp.]
MTQHLFVYGTLKRGYERHRTLSHQRFVSPAATMTPCRLFDCGHYPAMVQCSRGISVCGELYEVDSTCLQQCDVIEGVAEGLYARQLIQVVTIGDESSCSDAWTYIYRNSTVNLVDCGAEWAG